MKNGGKVETRGGLKRRRENNFGTPCEIIGKLKGGGGSVGIWACSRTATEREIHSRWVVCMLGRRR